MNSATDIVATLNDSQRRAVEHYKGPLLILAGAGSGKTRVLTHRIAYLIKEYEINPNSILGLTFTNKAAEEMAQRLKQLMDRDIPEAVFPWLGTFHSLGAEFLRQHAEYLDTEQDRYFTVFDSQDQRKAIKEALIELDLSTEEFSPRMLLNFINQAKNDLIGPDNFRAERRGKIEDYLLDVTSRVYQGYQERVESCNAFDFGDLIRIPVSLLEENHPVINRWRSQFDFILIDEYQDTNRGQYKLSRLLAEDHNNICVVGDDDQAIFGWRGADLSNILEFEQDFPETEVIRLSTNYRSTQTILGCANSLIANNDYRKEKKMTPDRGVGDQVRVYPADDEKAEATFVASEIDELCKNGVSPGEIAILYRINTLSRQLEEALIYNNIPYEVIKGTRFYERREIKDILAYLRVIVNPTDNISLLRIINRPRRGIGDATENSLRSLADEQNISLWQAAREVADSDDLLRARARNRMGNFVKLIRQFKSKREEYEPSELARVLVDNLNYRRHLNKAYDSSSAQERFNNIKELLGHMEEFEQQGTSLEDFLETVALESDISQFEDESNDVSLMTLHSAKGLEFSHVFLVGMEEGILPHKQALEENRLEEERRLCYVGITRAKDSLCLTYTGQRFLYGSTFNQARSRFLQEIDDHHLSYLRSVPSGSDSPVRPPIKQENSGDQWKNFLDP